MFNFTTKIPLNPFQGQKCQSDFCEEILENSGNDPKNFVPYSPVN